VTLTGNGMDGAPNIGCRNNGASSFVTKDRDRYKGSAIS
jgi:hypothetical protein